MPPRKTIAALAILVYGLGSLTYAISETDILSASLSSQKRGERQQKRGGWLQPARSSVPKSVCTQQEECTTAAKAPPCGSAQHACSKSRRGKECGKTGTQVSYCYSCAAPAWIDSSHHWCP